MEGTAVDRTEEEGENSAVCSNGHCGNGGGKKRESVDLREDDTGEGGVKLAGEEPEAVAPGNKRALSQDENDMRQ